MAPVSSGTLLTRLRRPSTHFGTPAGRPNSERSSTLNAFVALVSIILIVTAGGVLSTLISTIGKVLGSRAAARELPGDSSQVGSGEHEGNRDTIEDLSSRLERLEEERDFYKDLLDSPKGRREIRPPDTEEGAIGK